MDDDLLNGQISPNLIIAADGPSFSLEIMENV